MIKKSELTVIMNGIDGVSKKPLLVFENDDTNTHIVLAKFISKETAELFLMQELKERGIS